MGIDYTEFRVVRSKVVEDFEKELNDLEEDHWMPHYESFRVADDGTLWVIVSRRVPLMSKPKYRGIAVGEVSTALPSAAAERSDRGGSS